MKLLFDENLSLKLPNCLKEKITIDEPEQEIIIKWITH
jgi:hypothetical protein